MWHTVEQLRENQALTAEGFLIGRNVPIARTGTQLYSPADLPGSLGASSSVDPNVINATQLQAAP